MKKEFLFAFCIKITWDDISRATKSKPTMFNNLRQRNECNCPASLATVVWSLQNGGERALPDKRKRH